MPSFNCQIIQSLSFYDYPPAKNPQRKKLAKELEEEESVLKQCIEKLQSVEASRLALITQLKEALHVQVS